MPGQRRRHGGVEVTHRRAADRAVLDQQIRLHADERGRPQRQVRHVARLDVARSLEAAHVAGIGASVSARCIASGSSAITLR